ncbi:MAG: hypothetical protein CMK32_08080 [Porticoccaceae bacterium]|nr:hypothetical protein [Porticoccaceae bacterium]
MFDAPKHKVPIGTPVWFIQYGADDSTPLPATVISIADNLVCRLQIITPDGPTVTNTAVHPYGHQTLRDENNAPSTNARRNGAWTYNPWFKPGTTMKPEPTTEELVKTLYEEHGDLKKVCARVRSKGISKSQVEDILNL